MEHACGPGAGRRTGDRGRTYPPVVEKPEYKRYQDAITALDAALYSRETDEVLLNREAAVVNAAAELAQVVFAPPHADAGPDQNIATQTDHAEVKLDASGSQTHDDQKIVRYHWDKEE